MGQKMNSMRYLYQPCYECGAWALEPPSPPNELRRSKTVQCRQPASPERPTRSARTAESKREVETESKAPEASTNCAVSAQIRFQSPAFFVPEGLMPKLLP